MPEKSSVPGPDGPRLLELFWPKMAHPHISSRTVTVLRPTPHFATFCSKIVFQGAILESSANPKSVKNHTFGFKSAQGPSKNEKGGG